MAYGRLCAHPIYTYAPGSNISQALKIWSEQSISGPNVHDMMYPTNGIPRYDKFTHERNIYLDKYFPFKGWIYKPQCYINSGTNKVQP